MTQNSVTPRPRYTFQRSSLYYFRYTLLPDISKVVGKQGLRYSLKTGYVKHAEIRSEEQISVIFFPNQKILGIITQHWDLKYRLTR